MDDDNKTWSETVPAHVFRARAVAMSEAIERLCFPKGASLDVGVTLMALHLTQRRVEYEIARSKLSPEDQKRILDQAQAQREDFDESLRSTRAARTAGQS